MAAAVAGAWGGFSVIAVISSWPKTHKIKSRVVFVVDIVVWSFSQLLVVCVQMKLNRAKYGVLLPGEFCVA